MAEFLKFHENWPFPSLIPLERNYGLTSVVVDSGRIWLSSKKYVKTII